MPEAPSHVLPLAPDQLAHRLDDGAPLLLLDVREEWEYAIAALPDATLLPLARVPSECDRLPRDHDIVVYCHHGVRSMAAAQFLVARGFASVYNLTGGIDRYSCDVDPRIPRY